MFGYVLDIIGKMFDEAYLLRDLFYLTTTGKELTTREICCEQVGERRLGKESRGIQESMRREGGMRGESDNM